MPLQETTANPLSHSLPLIKNPIWISTQLGGEVQLNNPEDFRLAQAQIIKEYDLGLPGITLNEFAERLELAKILTANTSELIARTGFSDESRSSLEQISKSTTSIELSGLIRSLLEGNYDGDTIIKLLGYNIADKGFKVDDFEPLLAAPGSEAYYLGSLIKHEFNNLLGNELASLIQMAVDLEDHTIISEFEGNSGVTISSRLDNAIKLLEIVRTGLEVRSFNYNIKDLLQTLPVYPDIEVEYDPKSPVSFKSIEEFLTMRTLIHNSMKAARSMRERNKSFVPCIILTQAQEQNSYTLYDNIPDTGGETPVPAKDQMVRWHKNNIKSCREAYKEGQKSHGLPYLSSRNGLLMAAYMAGVRNRLGKMDENFNLRMQDSLKLKYIEIRY